MLHKTMGPKLLTSIKNHPSSSEDVLACNLSFRVLKSIDVEVADELVVMLNLFCLVVRTFLLVNNLFLPLMLATKIKLCRSLFCTLQIKSYKLIKIMKITVTLNNILKAHFLRIESN